MASSSRYNTITYGRIDIINTHTNNIKLFTVMKFEFKNAHKFGWTGLKGWAFNKKEDFPNASAAYFEITGRHGKVRTSHSDRIYFVVNGKGEFNINDKTIKVKKKDVIIVPKDTPYDYKATSSVLRLFLVHSPAFNPEADVKLE